MSHQEVRLLESHFENFTWQPVTSFVKLVRRTTTVVLGASKDPWSKSRLGAGRPAPLCQFGQSDPRQQPVGADSPGKAPNGKKIIFRFSNLNEKGYLGKRNKLPTQRFLR